MRPGSQVTDVFEKAEVKYPHGAAGPAKKAAAPAKKEAAAKKEAPKKEDTKKPAAKKLSAKKPAAKKGEYASILYFYDVCDAVFHPSNKLKLNNILVIHWL